jgi:hypothetical protein
MHGNKNRAHTLMALNNKGAASINNLPKQDKNNFIRELKKQFSINRAMSEFRC